MPLLCSLSNPTANSMWFHGQRKRTTTSSLSSFMGDLLTHNTQEAFPVGVQSDPQAQSHRRLLHGLRWLCTGTSSQHPSLKISATSCASCSGLYLPSPAGLLSLAQLPFSSSSWLTVSQWRLGWLWDFLVSLLSRTKVCNACETLILCIFPFLCLFTNRGLVQYQLLNCVWKQNSNWRILVQIIQSHHS